MVRILGLGIGCVDGWLDGAVPDVYWRLAWGYAMLCLSIFVSCLVCLLVRNSPVSLWMVSSGVVLYGLLVCFFVILHWVCKGYTSFCLIDRTQGV